jgi:hypothetical protein
MNYEKYTKTLSNRQKRKYTIDKKKNWKAHHITKLII